MHTWLIEWGLILLSTWMGVPRDSTPRPLTFEDRARAQEAIERVYYQHRIWPKENPGPKPPFEQMISKAQIEAKVEDYLKKSVALDKFWQRPIQPEQLQAEMDRMAKQTQDPETLKELFAALDNDPYLIAECLARPVLADRLIRNWFAVDERFHPQQECGAFLERDAFSRNAPSFEEWLRSIILPDFSQPILEPCNPSHYLLPIVPAERSSSPKGNWEPLNNVPEPRYYHTAIWTGSEMIVWGGDGIWHTTSGGRYDPSTDTWSPTSTGPGCPSARERHTAIWTGKEMIVWGSAVYGGGSNTGGRYDPLSNTWRPTSTGDHCPSSRSGHTAVWTGTEMIVWGGADNTGGRYDPNSDSWQPTSTGENCPAGGSGHTAIWTGQEMIVWNGDGTDGRYEPQTNTWKTVSRDAQSPSPRYGHTAVWTGTMMIIWGGNTETGYSNTGGSYDPDGDRWYMVPAGSDSPAPRADHTAVWSGTEMIVWGGTYSEYDTGGRYDPNHAAWSSTSTDANCPQGRFLHTAVWTGKEMIVWGGNNSGRLLNTGGRYDPSSDSWLPTSIGIGQPPFLFDNTAVWTGAEMIVWGGYDPQSHVCVNAGWRYDPSIGDWSSTAVGTECPPARRLHTAVWSGSEMIVWGGDNYPTSECLYSGGRYNPTADSWARTIEGLDVPSGRLLHTAVWTGTEMIIWGGQCWWLWDPEMVTGGRYSPSTDTWAPTSTGDHCPSPRQFASAVWTGSEMIIWGGVYGGITGTYLNDGSKYDPVKDRWTSTSVGAGCPSRRNGHTAVWTGREMIIWGGRPNSSDNTNTGARYDPAADAWNPTSTSGDCPSAGFAYTAVWTGAWMIIWGGTGTDGMINTGSLYSPEQDLWIPTTTDSNVPEPRYRHLSVLTKLGMIIWGPMGNGGILRLESPHGRPVAKPE